jgi:hypothetical protein
MFVELSRDIRPNPGGVKCAGRTPTLLFKVIHILLNNLVQLSSYTHFEKRAPRVMLFLLPNATANVSRRTLDAFCQLNRTRIWTPTGLGGRFTSRLFPNRIQHPFRFASHISPLTGFGLRSQSWCLLNITPLRGSRGSCFTVEVWISGLHF